MKSTQKTIHSSSIPQLLKWLSALPLILLMALSTHVFAQAGGGGISGLVSDPSGAVVRGAKVTVQNPATGVAQSTVTTAAGLYSFVSLSPGTYEVTTSQKGFSTVVQSNVTVSVDQTTTLNIVLRVGSVNQVVTVTGSSSLMETSNSTVGQLIGAATIDRVPLFSRDVYELVQLSAGVIPTNGSPNAADTPAIFNARSLLDVSAYTINGALLASTNYMVDGSTLSIIEVQEGTIMPAMQIPEDDVEEYRVETQSVPVTYQSSAGGVISLATKSGTNKFHGDGFVVLRPDVLAANDYFLKNSQLSSGEPNQPASFHRYQEGGSIGGPILHDKLFFFADYEGTQQESLETDTLTFPTAAERTGDFSADSFTVYNPLVADTSDGTRQPFAGNKIPQGDLDPVALKIAPNFPLPNQTGVGPYHLNNYFFSGLDPNNAQKFDIRADYDPSQKQHIFGRFSFGRLFFGSADAYGNIWDPDYYSNTTNERNILVADDYTLGSHSMLQLRYSFARQYENQITPGQYGFNIATLGFPTALASQVTFPIPPYIGFNNFTSALGGGGGDGWFFPYHSENSDASVSYTSTVGKQVLSAGLEYEKQFLNAGGPYLPSGGYIFDNTATSSTTFAGDGSDFGSFLLGMGSFPGNESPNFTDTITTAEDNPYYGAFIQDNYQLSKNINVTLGLRWDIFGGRTERYNRLDYFDPAVQYSVDGVPLTGGVEFVGVNGRSRTPFLTNMKNFAPRISVAWQPTHQFVVHGGAGIYYGPSTHMSGGSSNDNDGFNTTTSWDATAYNADGNSVMVNPLSNPFPAGVVQPTGATLGPATGVGSTLYTVLHSQRTPTIYNYNLGIEYQFPHDVVLSAAFVGSRGSFLPLNSADLNQLSLSTIGQYGNALNNPVPNQWEAALPPTSAFYGQATVPQWLALESYPQFSSGGINNGVVIGGYPGGDSEYDSLQTKVEKRLTKHVMTLATYTWGKILTDESNAPLGFVGYHGGAVQDWKDMQLEHSLSPQDIHYQFTWDTSYDLPIGKGRALDLNGAANTIFGNWTVNWVAYLSSGVPIATPNGTEDPFFNQRVDMNCDPGKGAPHTVAEWFNYTCFSQPSSQFVAGKSPTYLSHVRTNGAHDLDVSLYKNFPLGKERNLRFDVFAYNATNSVQFGYPNVFWNPSPTAANMSGFGQITNDINTPRQWQVQSKFTF